MVGVPTTQQTAPLQDYIVFIYNILMYNYITIFQLHQQFYNYNNTLCQLHHFHSITIIVLFNYNNDDHTITTIPWNHNNSLITITSCIASPHLENTTTIPTSTSHLILHRIIVKYYCLHQRHLFTIKLQILQ